MRTGVRGRGGMGMADAVGREVPSAMLACCVVVVELERARRPPARLGYGCGGPAVDWQRDPGNDDWNGILWECTVRPCGTGITGRWLLRTNPMCRRALSCSRYDIG